MRTIFVSTVLALGALAICFGLAPSQAQAQHGGGYQHHGYSGYHGGHYGPSVSISVGAGYYAPRYAYGAGYNMPGYYGGGYAGTGYCAPSYSYGSIYYAPAYPRYGYTPGYYGSLYYGSRR